MNRREFLLKTFRMGGAVACASAGFSMFDIGFAKKILADEGVSYNGASRGNYVSGACNGSTLDSYTSGTGVVGLSSASYNIYDTLSFVATGTYNICSIKTQIYKAGTEGNPTGDIYAYIYSDNGSGSPSSLLGSCVSPIDATTIPSSAGDYTTWTLSSQVSISSGTRYHIALYKATYSSTNYIYIRANVLGTGYNNRSGNGSTWTIDDSTFQGNFYVTD